MPRSFKHSLFRIAILCLAVAVHGCGGGSASTGNSGGDSGGGGGTPLPPVSATLLYWDPPSSYTDNTPLNPVTELDSFEIFVNESGIFTDADTPIALVRAVDNVTGQVAETFDLANVAPFLSRGVAYRVSVRAVAITGFKSDFSMSASFSL